ncbi:endonuclease/exonuclease/phosphatase family protein [Spirosoma sp. BT702]|uniref:Endonuclease/exonuclease/phosphatase family protein n=1 Tax=Spirosoma profusum TaxID=2771354 RepID=A0A926XT57_9BACT|nr:putative Ig domain-containing protein [Spirosoma profusum]MBD2699724.1 endonuclease/exonuclease/phosphatase family protein [Spirosoma profusum]
MLLRLRAANLLWLLCATFFFALTGRAQTPLLTEDFTSAPLPYTLTTSPSVWIPHSGTGTNSIQASSPGLTYAGLTTAGGSAAMTTGEDVNRTFTTQSSGPVYASFLVNVSSATSTGDYFFHLSTSPANGTYFVGRVYVRSASGGFQFGLGKNSESSSVYNSTVLSTGTTYFVVLKYTLNGGLINDQADLFVSPVLGQAEPVATITTSFTSTDAPTIGSVALRQAAGNAPNLRVDYIRVGTTWGSVTTNAPTLTTTPTSLTGFTTFEGTTSATKSYTLTGNNLTDPVSVSSTTDIEFSPDGVIFYTTPLSFTPSSGALSQVIYVRLADTAPLGSFSGTITNTASSTLAASVPVSGQVNDPNAVIVSIAATDATGAEEGSDPVVFTVSRTGDLTNPLTVTYTVGGNATNGTDYTPTLSGTVTVPAFQSSVDITLTPVDDALFEATETINLMLAEVVAYEVGTSSATATIADNDTRIRHIQGNGHISPLAGTTVTNVPGIVTALRSSGFWMQDSSPDNDDNTSEGIFVFTSTNPTVLVGQEVRVSGTAQEYRAGNDQNLSVTQIASTMVTVWSLDNPLPAPIVISSQIGAGRRIPTDVISNDFPASGDVELSIFDPTEDGLDFFETLEGMRVQINNPVTTGFRNTFGELYVIADQGAGATGVNARRSITISGANSTSIGSAITNSDFNPERIQIDDVLYGNGNTPNENVGTLLNTIIGVVNYDFLNYEILPSVAPTVSASNVPLTKETSGLIPTTNQLLVASFNVENLAGNEPQAKFDGLAAAIRTNLASPDIIALEEIQDNDGSANSGTVDASTTLSRLISAITAAGGPTYQYRQINPVDGADGGQSGGNIRVGILFNPARVQFVDRPGGGSTVNTTVSNVGGLPRISSSPGRILDPNPGEVDSYVGDDFTATRKPLVGELMFNGQPIYLIVNHFSSRGGSGALTQRFQPPTQEEQGRREEQAKVVNDFVDQLLAVNPNTNIIVAGDFNEFQFLPALQYLKGNVNGGTAVLTNLIETLPVEERYTYNFDGNAQALDYILASNFMSVNGYDAIHMNAEFLDQLSDHDPSVARFNFPPVPAPLALTLTANPTTLLTTGSTSLSAIVSGGTGPYSYTFSGPGMITPTSHSATVSGIPAGVQTFTVTIADSTTPTSQTISATVSVTVTQANTAPTVANPILSQTATVGVAYSFSVSNTVPAPTFTDAETPNSLTLSVSGLPAGLSFAAPNVISGTPSTTVGSPFTVTVTATDPGNLSVSTTFTLTIAPPPNTAPTLVTPIGNQTATVGLAYSFTVPAGTFTDAQTPNSLVLSVSGLPAGLSFTAPSTISGTPSTTVGSPFTVTVKATDPDGLSASTTFTLTVLPPPNTPPTVANLIGSQTATVGQAYSFNIPSNTFTDAQTPGSLTLSVSGLPAGLNFTAPNVISGTPSTTVGSPFTVTVKATDPGSLSVSTTFQLTVLPVPNTAPTVVGSIGNRTAPVNQAFTMNIPAGIFTDAQTPNGLVLSVSGLPAGLSFTAPSTISGTPSTTVGSPFTVTVVATDPGGLSVATTFQITVSNTASCVNMFTVKTGNWNDPTVWSCGRLPVSTDPVTVNHVVTLPAGYTGNALRVTFGPGGRITHSSGSRLKLVVN